MIPASPVRTDAIRRFIKKGAVAFLVTVVALASLAAILRFHDLGAWPYSGDETSTLWEESILFHNVVAAPDRQEYRLPHLIPVSYLAFHISHTLFGSDEWGTRVVVAVLGVLSVVLVFVFLRGPMSPTTAIVAAVLVAVMPQHVLHSQETRFYMVAAFFAYASLLAGALIVRNRSTLFAVLTCCLIFLAILSHTLMVVLLPIIFLAVLVGVRAQGQTVPRAVWLVFAATAAALGIYFVLRVRPLLQGWNETAAWGYSPIHAILASIVMIGWPIALLAIVGSVLVLREREGQGCYWLVCFLGWASMSVAFPLIVPYHPEYVFPLSLSALVIAAYAITVVSNLLRTRARSAAYTWLVLICLANLPALASYYVDGSRWNFRDAARYVREHWSPGDRVTAYSVGLFRQYSHGCCEPDIPLDPKSIPQLTSFASEAGRTWVVLEATRSGLNPQVQRWLFDCAVHKLSVGGRRFDDALLSVEVYVITSPQQKTCTRETQPARD